MSAIENIRNALPEAAKDIRLNLQNVLEGGSLSKEQRWGIALACAYASRNPHLRDGVLADARADGATDALVEDAKAAAVLMAMNNVYYRFRHFMGPEKSYHTKRPNLRMTRIAQVATNKVDFELFCLAVSAINGCEMCVESHEKVVIDGGLSDENVHDAVRIASTIHAVAVGLEVDQPAGVA